MAMRKSSTPIFSFFSCIKYSAFLHSTFRFFLSFSLLLRIIRALLLSWLKITVRNWNLEFGNWRLPIFLYSQFLPFSSFLSSFYPYTQYTIHSTQDILQTLKWKTKQCKTTHTKLTRNFVQLLCTLYYTFYSLFSMLYFYALSLAHLNFDFEFRIQNVHQKVVAEQEQEEDEQEADFSSSLLLFFSLSFLFL